MTNHPFPQTTDEYMTQNGWVEHDNFWSLASDEWAKATMAKAAAEVVFRTYLQGIREAEREATEKAVIHIAGCKTEGLFDNGDLFIKRAPLEQAFVDLVGYEKFRAIKDALPVADPTKTSGLES